MDANRGPQETEWLSRYFSEGNWNTELKPEEFYRNYARRILGERAQDEMFQAFMALEEKEFETSGPNRDMLCCRPPTELIIAKRYAEQPNPYDGPAFKGWGEFSREIPDTIKAYSRDLTLLKRAARHLENAAAVVTSAGEHQLNYLRNRTEAYVWHLKALIELLEGYDRLDRAFRMDVLGKRKDLLRQLDDSLARFQSARVYSRHVAQTWAESSDYVSDSEALYRINTFMVTGTQLIAEFIENIVNFHHGKPYLKPTHWEEVFSPLPARQN